MDVLQSDRIHHYCIIYAGVKTLARSSQEDTSLSAVDPSELGTVWALTVGVNAYRHAPRLQFAVNDARAIRDRIIPRIPGLAYKVTHLEDDDATKDRILRAAEGLVAAASNDTVLIYFSMHGLTDKNGDNGFLLSYDADPANVEGTSVPVRALVEKVGRTRAARVFMISDVAFTAGRAVEIWSEGARAIQVVPNTR